MSDRKQRLARLAAIHDAWVAENLESAEFSPDSRPESRDYNLWYVDMDADPETEKKFQDAVGDEDF